MHAKPARTRRRARVSTRRKTVRWSTREVDALLAGVRAHGVGKWARILRHSPVFNGVRTSVDLKDKWRNLTSPVRAAALAGETLPIPDPPATPPAQHSPQPDSSSPVSALHTIAEPTIEQQPAEHPVSTSPSTDSPPSTVPLSDFPPVTPELLTTPAFTAPSMNPITPYTISQSFYHSAATIAADYWRRVARDTVYGIGPHPPMFPYVKQDHLMHSDEYDDDDDDDDDDEAVQQPLYNPYVVAVAQMYGRLEPASFGCALFPISADQYTAETETRDKDECIAREADCPSEPPNMDSNVSSSATGMNIASDADQPKAPVEDADDTTVEAALFDVEERKTSTSGDSDQSLLHDEPLYDPLTTLG